MPYKCAACLKNITGRRFLECSLCTEKYDIQCVNVPEKRFYNTMSNDHKKAWRCPQCKAKQPKLDNTNTPIRHQTECTKNNENEMRGHEQQMDDNVTTRRKFNVRNDETCSFILDDTMPHGDTLKNESSVSIDNNLLLEIRELRAQITLQSQKQDSRHQELSDTIKLIQACVLNITSQYNFLETEIVALKSLTENNTKRIKDLENKNSQLNQELIKYKETKCEVVETENAKNTVNIEKSVEDSTTNNKKIIVLYGLDESRYESDYELHDRIVNLFYDIMGIDLTGYIEDMCRIGKRGNRRALKIEFLSKRVTKNILEGVKNFKNTKFWISEYLNEKGLERRKREKQKYLKSKRSSLFATSQKNYVNIKNREDHSIMVNSTIPTRKRVPEPLMHSYEEREKFFRHY